MARLSLVLTAIASCVLLTAAFQSPQLSRRIVGQDVLSEFKFVRPSQVLSPVSQTAITAARQRIPDEEFMRYDKASRSAGSGDNVVELIRPLGLVLKEDEYRNVYVETVAPRGNAARTGKVQEGDYLVMCSATFGDEMWSTRGAGLSRVLAAIRLRAGSTVKLVFESPNQSKRKQAVTMQQLKAREEAAAAAQAKKDRLLKELEQDEQRLNPKKFFGLF